MGWGNFLVVVEGQPVISTLGGNFLRYVTMGARGCGKSIVMYEEKNLCVFPPTFLILVGSCRLFHCESPNQKLFIDSFIIYGSLDSIPDRYLQVKSQL